MELKPGSRWKSAVCDGEVVVVRPPKLEAVLECGGHAMTPHGADRPQGLALSPDHAEGIKLGKRYYDEETGLEALCSKPGAGSLSINGRPAKVRDAKKLPSSD